MLHEKILKRDDGSRVKILVDFCVVNFSDTGFKFFSDVRTCAKGKRTFNVLNFDDYEYRALTIKERQEFYVQRQLEHVTKEELLQAKLELWEKMKPTEDNVT